MLGNKKMKKHLLFANRCFNKTELIETVVNIYIRR